MLRASVGYLGNNDKTDVTYIQKTLNKHLGAGSSSALKPLQEDGICGKKTISSISRFQAEVVGLARPDGRIDPGGKTLKVLEKSGGAFSQVPLAAGVGVKVATSAKSGVTSSAQPNLVSVATGQTDPRKLKTRSEIALVYGSISEDKKWAKQGQFLVGYTIPANIQSDPNYHWINVYNPKKSKVSVVYCHKAMHPFLDKALKNLVARNLLADLTEYGGCHAIRATRGTTNWSAHSWALAIDLNMTGNELGKVPKMSKEFAQCFIDAGFGWGGNYSRQDGMHFTLAGFDMPRH